MDKSDKVQLAAVLDPVTLNEVQLVLAEKRTALSTLRTGIAIFAFPLSVISVLIATSQHWSAEDVLAGLIALMLINAALVVLGIYLIFIAIRRIRHYDQLIDEFKCKFTRLAELLD